MRHGLLSIMAVTASLWAASAAACVNFDESQKINQLLTRIEHSNMQFIRDGGTYDGIAARRHLEEKLQFAGSRITTAEQFIHYIASTSSLTGEPYRVRFANGE